ncbi:hypothetical protein [Bacillus sp. JJ722]|uniref:hypothetical protein n=1 Tax=Bacillus sp. JJ722 TaxID=3122973 RepID=UPI002FFEE3A7
MNIKTEIIIQTKFNEEETVEFRGASEQVRADILASNVELIKSELVGLFPAESTFEVKIKEGE